MIHCKPQRLLSWDYYIEGEGLEAESTIERFRERGTVWINGVGYEVRKHGLLSGMWTMNRGSSELAVAQKMRPTTRTFQIQTRSGLLSMRPMSPMRRSFLLLRPEGIVGRIEVRHLLSRKATIDLSPGEDDHASACFAFWLAVLTWKRRLRRGG